MIDIDRYSSHPQTFPNPFPNLAHSTSIYFSEKTINKQQTPSKPRKQNKTLPPQTNKLWSQIKTYKICGNHISEKKKNSTKGKQKWKLKTYKS